MLSHPLPRLLRRCTGRGSARSWPRSRLGPVLRPHTPHRWVRSDTASGTFGPRREQSCEVPAGRAWTNGIPAGSALSFRMSRNSRQPCSAIGRFPGPLQSMLLISSATTAMNLQVLVTRSARRWSSSRPASAIRSWARASAAFFYSWLIDPRVLRGTARCFLRIALCTKCLVRRCRLPPPDGLAKPRMLVSIPTWRTGTVEEHEHGWIRSGRRRPDAEGSTACRKVRTATGNAFESAPLESADSDRRCFADRIGRTAPGQPSVRKRAGQVSPGRVAIRGRGTNRFGPPP